jgi:hypothetical protein
VRCAVVSSIVLSLPITEVSLTYFWPTTYVIEVLIAF